MKKILIIVLALALVIGISATTFAEASDRAKEVTEENKGKALGIEKQEERDGRLMKLFELYFPEGVEDLKEVREEHVAFHEQAKSDFEALREAIKADFDEIKAAVESGELSRREGQVLIINLRMEIRLMRNEIDEVNLAKIEAQGPVHDRILEIKEEIKVLLSVDPVDEDAMKALLIESLGLFETHLDNDIYFHGLKVDIAAAYGY